jgi:anaerobic selenocysteine-containing dehydrogenase
MQSPDSLARAGFGGSPLEAARALFTAILASPSGVIFAVDDWSQVLGRIATGDGKIHLALPDLLAELARLRDEREQEDPAFPFVLSAGERRSFTANTIIRDPAWRKKDAEGALRMSPADAEALGVRSGDRVRLSTRRGSAVATVEVSDVMQRGHVSLPNGLGVTYPAGADEHASGIAPNELTAVEDRDPFVGTPWHKHVPARVERV